MEVKTICRKRVASLRKTTGKSFPTWKEMQQIREERVSRYGFDPATECGMLSSGQLADVIREAEEGPFYTLEDGRQMIRQWREQRQNR